MLTPEKVQKLNAKYNSYPMPACVYKPIDKLEAYGYKFYKIEARDIEGDEAKTKTCYLVSGASATKLNEACKNCMARHSDIYQANPQDFKIYRERYKAYECDMTKIYISDDIDISKFL